MVTRLSGLMLVVCLAVPVLAADGVRLDLGQPERDRILKTADGLLTESPVTVTNSRCTRSAGGLHDFYSEGDYWWPNPADANGPYIQRDGMTNPENFVEHRRAMVRMSIHVATLTAAWRLTHDHKYADHAIRHLRAWFVAAPTRMNPNLQFAQAIKGVSTGRGIGIIDTIQLVEVARAASLLERDKALVGENLDGTRQWFAAYIRWMTTSKNGLDEKKAANNHGTCWVMQVAAFASFVGDEEKLAECRTRFKETLLPDQMAADGSFPRELKRTKPYGYSLFNLDAMATICLILSTPADDLWRYTTPDGRSMHNGLEFMYPYIRDKSKWPGKPDVMFFEFWPVRSPALVFGAIAFGESKYLELWKSLEPNPTNEEVLRNLPVRQALLWVES